ncbi:repeat element protein-b4.1 [Ichnoviriform fugitivi]|uniref:Repeat element protein-b4.1 n=1 Tax=Ichnoviriform fugitivi TaxID=265522 RepID=A2Q0D7_9VIRU|nr:repeat element protein-b4.1 [Ichnoviriform fugitivi]BAF45652.1 repeat element protein-b4.1 [Ichnoviriform fugitivi]
MDLGCDILLYMSKFMNFQDFKNLTVALWPNGGEDNAISEKLWKLSTYIKSTEFCNRKRVQIEYNYDPTRARKDRILINVESLLPVFHGIVLPDLPVSAKFLSVRKLNKLIIRQIRSTKTLRTQPAASNVELTSYHCTWYTHTLEERSHSHHLMWKHVYWWLNEHIIDDILWRLQPRVPRTPLLYTFSRRMKKKASQTCRSLMSMVIGRSADATVPRDFDLREVLSPRRLCDVLRNANSHAVLD